tara:strand:- start:452 stop:1480 length:1029 start_codon:yes stop_codon:yes gene_type:complete
MAQHDFVIDNQSFPSFRSDLNSVLQAIVSNNSGTSEPSTTFANQLFYNSSTNVLSIRNEDNDAFIPLMQFDQSADVAATLATVIDILDASGTDQAGTSLTIRAGAGTGTGAGGSIILQTADGGSSGSSVNAHATAVTILDNGNVGIGNSPDKKLDVSSSGTSSETIAQFGNGNITGGLQIQTNGNLEWGFNALNTRSLTFSTNQTERLRVLSSGGLTFNGDTAAANALDDYEEGTWTPVHGGNNMTTGDRTKYTKIGRAVFLVIDATSASGSSATQIISGLPFTPDGSFGAVHIAFTTADGIQGGFIGNNNPEITLVQAGTSSSDILNAGTRIIGTGMYFTT